MLVAVAISVVIVSIKMYIISMDPVNSNRKSCCCLSLRYLVIILLTKIFYSKTYNKVDDARQTENYLINYSMTTVLIDRRSRFNCFFISFVVPNRTRAYCQPDWFRLGKGYIVNNTHNIL